LGQALLPLIQDQDATVEVLDVYKTIYPVQLDQRMSAKLGLQQVKNGDHELIDAVFRLLATERTDFTIFWRRLSQAVTGYSNGKQIAAFFPKTELAEGQSLELSAKVNFTGVSGMGNFRYGVFQKRSRDHSRGWLGYCAYTGIDKKFPKGGLYASDPGNDVSFDQATSRVLGVTLVPFKNIKDGAYQIKMSLKLVGTSIQSSAALSSIGSQVVEFARYDGTDTQPSTTSFDALGFTTHELLSADSFSLSEVSVKLVGP